MKLAEALILRSETIVTEIFDCSSASEELREAVENGASWIESMTATLARLDQLCRQ
jgi:hypothetical protein